MLLYFELAYRYGTLAVVDLQCRHELAALGVADDV
jgi:hypothetical protein